MSAGCRTSPTQASAALLAAVCLVLGPILCARLCQLANVFVRAQTIQSAGHLLALHHAGMGETAPENEQLPLSHRHPPVEQMKQLLLGVTEALPRLVLFAFVLIGLGAMTALKHPATDQHSPRVPHPPPRCMALLPV